MSGNQQYTLDDHVSPPKQLPEMPFERMSVGQSFLIPGLTNKTDIAAIRQRMHRYQKSNWPVRLSLVKDKEVPDAMRLFRLADRQGNDNT